MRGQQLPGGRVLRIHCQALGRGQETAGGLHDIAASLGGGEGREGERGKGRGGEGREGRGGEEREREGGGEGGGEGRGGDRRKRKSDEE